MAKILMAPVRLVLPVRPDLLPVSDEAAPMGAVQALRDELMRTKIRADETDTARRMAVSRWQSSDAAYEGALTEIRKLALRLAVYEPEDDDGLPVAGVRLTKK